MSDEQLNQGQPEDVSNVIRELHRELGEIKTELRVAKLGPRVESLEQGQGAINRKLWFAAILGSVISLVVVIVFGISLVQLPNYITAKVQQNADIQIIEEKKRIASEAAEDASKFLNRVKEDSENIRRILEGLENDTQLRVRSVELVDANNVVRSRWQCDDMSQVSFEFLDARDASAPVLTFHNDVEASLITASGSVTVDNAVVKDKLIVSPGGTSTQLEGGKILLKGGGQPAVMLNAGGIPNFNSVAVYDPGGQSRIELRAWRRKDADSAGRKKSASLRIEPPPEQRKGTDPTKFISHPDDQPN